MTQKEMQDYGYCWEGMIPLSFEDVLHVTDEHPIYLLYPDDTECLVEHGHDIIEHAERGGIFGIEKR